MNEEYREAFFKLGCEVQDLPRSFAIVTACNPNGEAQDDAANESLDRELKEELTRKGVDFFRATGGSKDMSHAEPGFGAVVGMKEAVELGKAWKQEAVFWIEGDELFLVSCLASQPEPESMGSFRDRILS